MANNTLNSAYVGGDTILADHSKQHSTALSGDMVGRDANGVAASGQSLGTALLPWGTLHANAISIGGSVVDLSGLTASNYRIVSGRTSSSSQRPDFLRPDGTSLNITIAGADTDLVLSIGGSTVTVSADITVLTTAAPATNNTALINISGLSNDLWRGDDDPSESIVIDAAGTAVVGEIGNYVAFQSSNGEIITGYLESATSIINVRRGVGFNSTGDWVGRANLSDDDTITLLNVGWLFIENDATTTEISGTEPVYSEQSPSNPNSGDYWFDTSDGNRNWKRYDGSTWVIVNRILIGITYSSSTECVAVECLDPELSVSNLNTVSMRLIGDEEIQSVDRQNYISVYGRTIQLSTISFTTSDLQSGQTLEANTSYFAYLTEEGAEVLSNIKGRYRPDLRGDYHPAETWRLVGMVNTDADSDFELVWDENSRIESRSTIATQSITSGLFTTLTTTRVLSRGLRDEFIGELEEGSAETSFTCAPSSSALLRGSSSSGKQVISVVSSGVATAITTPAIRVRERASVGVNTYTAAARIQGGAGTVPDCVAVARLEHQR